MHRLNAKAWFAVERTFLHWASISVLILLASRLSLIFPVASCFLLLLAYSTYSSRLNLLINQPEIPKAALSPLFPAVILTFTISGHIGASFFLEI